MRKSSAYCGNSKSTAAVGCEYRGTGRRINMELSILIMKWLLVMFSLSGIGFLLAKLSLLAMRAVKSLVNLLLYAVTPLTVLNSFLVEKDTGKNTALLYSLLLSLAVFALFLCCYPTLYMGKEKELKISQQHSVMQASLVFHWYKQLLDHTQYFYIAGFVAFLNIYPMDLWCLCYGERKRRMMISFSGNY